MDISHCSISSGVIILVDLSHGMPISPVLSNTIFLKSWIQRWSSLRKNCTRSFMCCVRLMSLGYLLLLKALDRDLAFSLNVSMESSFLTLIVSMLCWGAVIGEGVWCGWLWSSHILSAI